MQADNTLPRVVASIRRSVTKEKLRLGLKNVLIIPSHKNPNRASYACREPIDDPTSTSWVILHKYRDCMSLVAKNPIVGEIPFEALYMMDAYVSVDFLAKLNQNDQGLRVSVTNRVFLYVQKCMPMVILDLAQDVPGDIRFEWMPGPLH